MPLPPLKKLFVLSIHREYHREYHRPFNLIFIFFWFQKLGARLQFERVIERVSCSMAFYSDKGDGRRFLKRCKCDAFSYAGPVAADSSEPHDTLLASSFWYVLSCLMLMDFLS
jgi:hypothetical protein